MMASGKGKSHHVNLGLRILHVLFGINRAFETTRRRGTQRMWAATHKKLTRKKRSKAMRLTADITKALAQAVANSFWDFKDSLHVESRVGWVEGGHRHREFLARRELRASLEGGRKHPDYAAGVAAIHAGRDERRLQYELFDTDLRKASYKGLPLPRIRDVKALKVPDIPLPREPMESEHADRRSRAADLIGLIRRSDADAADRFTDELSRTQPDDLGALLNRLYDHPSIAGPMEPGQCGVGMDMLSAGIAQALRAAANPRIDHSNEAPHGEEMAHRPRRRKRKVPPDQFTDYCGRCSAPRGMGDCEECRSLRLPVGERLPEDKKGRTESANGAIDTEQEMFEGWKPNPNGPGWVLIGNGPAPVDLDKVQQGTNKVTATPATTPKGHLHMTLNASTTGSSEFTGLPALGQDLEQAAEAARNAMEKFAQDAAAREQDAAKFTDESGKLAGDAEEIAAAAAGFQDMAAQVSGRKHNQGIAQAVAQAAEQFLGLAQATKNSADSFGALGEQANVTAEASKAGAAAAESTAAACEQAAEQIRALDGLAEWAGQHQSGAPLSDFAPA